MDPETYLDLFLNTKTTQPVYPPFSSWAISISTELAVWLAVYFGSFFVACGLSLYVYNYIVENRFAKKERRQQVFIVRSDPHLEISDLEKIDYIKEVASRPFRIISVDSSSDDLDREQALAFRKFMKRIVNTDEELYIVAKNIHRYEYKNYIYFSKLLGVETTIMEIIREDSLNSKPMDNYKYEQRCLFITL